MSYKSGHFHGFGIRIENPMFQDFLRPQIVIFRCYQFTLRFTVLNYLVICEDLVLILSVSVL